jgi:6-pyruvoyltetrahydropterin/6-carboxytetrahydropterin synthase
MTIFYMKSLQDKDIRYVGQNGVIYRSRTELTLAKLLSFLNHDFEYNVTFPGPFHSKPLTLDFKTDNKYIEVIDSDADLQKFKTIKEKNPEIEIIAIGSSRYLAKIDELESVFFYDSYDNDISSIFIEDPSLAFDYAHILPLVERCSILHGHTSNIMVEIIGTTKNNLVIDFADAKRIIKQTLNLMDHKFFICKKYLVKEDEMHYFVSFNGPQGNFNLQVPKATTYILSGEATVENLSTEIIRLLAPKMPTNIEALGVYIYEGTNKGAHLICGLDKRTDK